MRAQILNFQLALTFGLRPLDLSQLCKFNIGIASDWMKVMLFLKLVSAFQSTNLNSQFLSKLLNYYDESGI